MTRKLHSRLYLSVASTVLAMPLACAVAQEDSGNVQSLEQALEADPNCEASAYEAEEMFQSTGGPTPDGWNIWTNGYISTTHNFEGGTTMLTAVARGQFGGGAAPNMRITVGGTELFNTGVGSTDWTDYNFTFEAAAGEQEVRIYFTNDFFQNGQDRNLFIDKLIVGCGVGLCGNGTVDPGEECDDGSQTSADSCKMDCTWNVCGDGVQYTLITDPNSPNTAESCDDGNDVNNDECSNACELPVCGDEIVQANEQCDDGGTEDGDGCASDCSLEITGPCGDGILDDGEECDDGNLEDNDECTNACTLPRCGDGIVQSSEGEECDDGGTEDGDGCASDCSLEITGPCGDGIEDAGEECDDGNLEDNDGCTNACTLPRCGDGIVQSSEGEECDDGGNEDGDGCASDCSLEIADPCGNGIEDAGEECDDGNLDDNDECSNTCQLPVCGDEVVQGVEECDDGGNEDGDGCASDCTSEASASGAISVQTDWGTGYCATVVINNEALLPTTAWSAVVNLQGATTYTAWSGTFSGISGNVTVGSLNWNSVITAGGSIASSGFCVNYAPGTPVATVDSVNASY